jgi:hypothetical protein
MKQKREYRITEYNGRFEIQIKVYRKVGILRWRRIVDEWRDIDIYGNPRYICESVPIMTVPKHISFTTLEGAKRVVDRFKKGVIFHNC